MSFHKLFGRGESRRSSGKGRQYAVRRRLRRAVWGKPRLRGRKALALVLLPVLLVPATAIASSLRVVTTLPGLASIVESIGGDRVKVSHLCRGYQDPHYLEPKPSYGRSLRKADLLVYLGLELEAGWLPPLLTTARNPELRPGSPHLLEAAGAVDRILEVPQGGVDRSRGDIHPYGNPHVLLDPRNAVAIAGVVADRLTELDPDGAAAYEAGRARFQARMAQRIEHWEQASSSLKGKPVVAYHKQWEYLADWLGFELEGYIENFPGIPPSPAHVKRLIDRMSKDGVGVVIAATFVDVKGAKEVAQRAGARLVVLPADVGGVDDAGTYETLIDAIVSALVEAAS